MKYRGHEITLECHLGLPCEPFSHEHCSQDEINSGHDAVLATSPATSQPSFHAGHEATKPI
jgi:hypothetical protein